MNILVKKYAILACALTTLATTGLFAETQPNVLFIGIDDLKPWLGCYDHPVVKTPNLDRIARMGTVFRCNYCQVAICGASRISLLTGLRPDTTGVYNMGGEIFSIDTARKRAPHLETIPRHFKNQGYTSLGFGKVFDSRNTDNGQDRKSWSHPKGVQWNWDFTLWPDKPVGGGYQRPETRKLIEAALAKAKKRGLTKKAAINEFLSTVDGTRPVCEAEDLPDEAYAEGNVMAAPAVKTIHRQAKIYRDKGTPFFLAVGFYKPHLPFVAPKKYWDLYSPEDFELAAFQQYPVGGVRYAETDYVEGRGFHPVPTHGEIPEPLQRHMMHGYAACVSYVDAQVGKLLAALEEETLLENTVICVWGDHGFHLGDKQLWGKHTNFEEATRSPLIISSPTIPGGRVEDVCLTEFVDVFPTLCELADLKLPAKLEGKSLVGLMRGAQPATNPPAVCQYMRDTDEGKVMGWAIRNERYRYVEWRKIESANLAFTLSGNVLGVELYDYETDPAESRNLAPDSDYQDKLKEMVQLFDQTLPDLPNRF